MGRIADRFAEVLEPYVGHAVAGMVLRGAAGGMGKELAELTPDDVPAFADRLRSLLGPVMSTETVDAVLAEAERGLDR